MSVRLPVCEMSSIPAAPSPTSLALRCLCCSPLCLRSESGTRVRASARKENNEREMNLEENETLAACACDSFQLICLFCPPPLSLPHSHTLSPSHTLSHSLTHTLSRLSHALGLLYSTTAPPPPSQRQRQGQRARETGLLKQKKQTQGQRTSARTSGSVCARA